jgi:hypothetical protein
MGLGLASPLWSPTSLKLQAKGFKGNYFSEFERFPFSAPAAICRFMEISPGLTEPPNPAIVCHYL